MNKFKRILFLLFLFLSVCFIKTDIYATTQIKDSDVILESNFVEYNKDVMENGGSRIPDFKVVVNNKELAITKDYHLYVTNGSEIGIGTLTIEGIGNYTGKVDKNFQIKPRSICYYSNVLLYTKNISYKSKYGGIWKFKLGKRPKVLIGLCDGSDEYGFLVEGKDYKVSYSGTGKKRSIKLTGINNYSGTIIIPYCSDTWVYDWVYYYKKNKKSIKKADKFAKKEKKKFLWKNINFSDKPTRKTDDMFALYLTNEIDYRSFFYNYRKEKNKHYKEIYEIYQYEDKITKEWSF